MSIYPLLKMLSLFLDIQYNLSINKFLFHMNKNKIKYKIETSKSGLPALSIIDNKGKRIFLHSKYNPLNEKESLKDKFLPEKYDTVIILGAGLGYHLLALKDNIGEYKKIIIIDIIDKFESEIEKNDETKFLVKNKKIMFLTGMDYSEIEKTLHSEIDFEDINGINVIAHPASLRAFSEYYSKISEIIERLINKKAGDKATKKAFGMLYIRNIIRNLNSVSSYYPVASFFNKFGDYPAVIITSGPSIEGQLEQICERQDRLFIVAADSCVSLLQKNGINPDFFLSIDPQPYIFEHLADIDKQKIIPIISISSHPCAFMFSTGLVSLNTHPISQIIDDLTGYKIGSIDSRTGTVAGDALKTVSFFGFKMTALMGFDFSFPNYEIYPKGTSYQKRISNFHSRLLPIETHNLNYIMKSSKSIKLNGLYSRRSFVNYKEAMETFISREGIQNFYNINQYEIPIRNVPNISSKEFLKNYSKNKIEKHEIINNVLSGSEKIDNLLSINRVNEILSKKEIISEIISASMDKSAGLLKEKKITKLISKFNFTQS